jgi:acetyl-CoA carboxylase carboxyltransferase component
MVRHSARLFTVGAALTVPLITVVLRKAYGLGAMAMAGGSLHRPFMTLSWASGEFGAMGLEGAVKLGFKKELEAITDEAERAQLYDKLVAGAYEKGKAIRAATALEFDEVIAPEQTRQWVSTALATIDPATYAQGSGRYIDTW